MQVNKKNQIVGSMSLLSVGVLYGLSGVIAKYLSNWIDPYQVVEYRFFVAFIISMLALFVIKEKISFKGVNLKTLVLFSVTFPVSAIFFTLAIFNTSVSLVVFSFYIANLVASFAIGKIFFGEKITLDKKIALVLTLIALIVFTDPFSNFSIEIGLVFGLISGIIQAIASAYQKIVSKKAKRLSLVILQTSVGTLIASVAIMFTSQDILPSLPPLAVGVTIIFGVMFLLIIYLFLIGFRYINLNVGSILVSSELLFGPLFAILLLGESLSGSEFIGGLFTGVSVYYANKK